MVPHEWQDKAVAMAEPTTNEARIHAAENTNGLYDEALEQVRQALAGLRFGTISVIVQDGVVIQIERTERRRLRKNERT